MPPVNDREFEELMRLLENMQAPLGFQGHANNDWLVYIDRKMKDLEETVEAVGTAGAVAVCIFFLVTMLILRGCGG